MLTDSGYGQPVSSAKKSMHDQLLIHTVKLCKTITLFEVVLGDYAATKDDLTLVLELGSQKQESLLFSWSGNGCLGGI